MEKNDSLNELQQEAHPKTEELLENVSTPLEKSNNYAAEHVANGLASLTRAIGIIVGIIGLIAGIVLMSNNAFIGTLCIIVGLIFFLICLVSWAFIKLMVNVSYRLTRIDNKLKN